MFGLGTDAERQQFLALQHLVADDDVVSVGSRIGDGTTAGEQDAELARATSGR